MDARSPAPAWLLRPATAADAPFLERLFFAVRRPTFAALGLPEAALASLLLVQLRAQGAGYAQAFPDAEDRILEHPPGVPVGRLLVARSPSTWHLVDLAVLPEHHGLGLATAMLGALCAEADAGSAAIELTVDPANIPACRLYARAGFEQSASRPPTLELRRAPGRGNGLGEAPR